MSIYASYIALIIGIVCLSAMCFITILRKPKLPLLRLLNGKFVFWMPYPLVALATAHFCNLDMIAAPLIALSAAMFTYFVFGVYNVLSIKRGIF